MSTPPAGGRSREILLERLAAAGRAQSDAAVMFHSVLAERLGIGVTDWKTLGLLEQQGSLSAGRLAELTGLAPPSVTGILDRLERGGWIRRARDPADRRRVVVTLDPAVKVERFGRYFEGLGRRLADLYARYGERELALVLEVVQETARRQREATAELTRIS